MINFIMTENVRRNEDEFKGFNSKIWRKWIRR